MNAYTGHQEETKRLTKAQRKSFGEAHAGSGSIPVLDHSQDMTLPKWARDAAAKATTPYGTTHARDCHKKPGRSEYAPQAEKPIPQKVDISKLSPAQRSCRARATSQAHWDDMYLQQLHWIAAVGR
jgi:hypothetical protein